jgi:hypothetical protein
MTSQNDPCQPHGKGKQPIPEAQAYGAAFVLLAVLCVVAARWRKKL